jgi:hypothetical protein
MELYQQAVELMAQVTELAQENMEAKKRISELEERLERKANLIFHQNFYWYGTKTAIQFSATGGPFCSACFDTAGKLVRIHTRTMMGEVEYQICPVCEKSGKK